MPVAAKAQRMLPFLKPAEESKLLTSAVPKSFQAEDVVFEQNTALRTIYLIVDGSIRIERDDEGQVVPLAILGAGEFFGEMSFVDEAPTSARAVAQQSCKLHIIEAADIERLAERDPAFSARFYRSLAAILVQRLRRTSSLLSLDNRAV